MTPEDYARMRQLFDAASALPVAERRAYVESRVPEGDPLRDELLSMLAANEDTGFLRTPVSPALASEALQASSEPPLVQVGPYRILREVGRGGMGVVYLATRNDDVFQKTVALKVIGTAVERGTLIERFKQERQILAGLDHPNIARILDGGNTEDGRPYYVMEFVEGTPLDDYCGRVEADVPTRLRLVLQVCEALEYLHGQAIVHRDIKPSNILVTAEGRVKLLDFGIARAATPTPGGQATIIVTPGYGSPEQVVGGDVGKTADVYSLAVVLYELLTGKLPFVDAEGRPSLAIQLSGEKPKPASQVVPERPSKSTTAFLKTIRPDLDRILETALQKEPLRRYPSVTLFAEDVRRYLDGRPISARSDNWLYSARLFLGRNRIAAALAALLLVSVGAGGWSLIETRIERVRLEAKEKEIERLVGLLNSRVERWQGGETTVPQVERIADVQTAGQMMVSDTLTELSERAPDPARLKRLIAELRRFLDRAEELSNDQPPVRKEISIVYRKVGDFENDDARPRIADRTQATQSYRKAAVIAASVRAEEPAWADQQIAEISSELQGLGSTLPQEATTVSAPPPEPPAPATPPPPVKTVARVAPQVPAPVPSASGPDPAAVAELQDRLRATTLKASRTRTTIDELRTRVTAQGQTMRTDLTASMAQVDGLIEQAAKLLETGDLTNAEDLLRRADYELRRLTQAVGG